MVFEIKIPIVDQTTEEVRIVAWIKSVGDEVKKGDLLFEIETDKAAMEVESTATGTLLKQLVEVDDMIPVGEVIGFIGPKGTSVDTKTASGVQEKPTEQIPRQARIKASPLARKIAQNKGIDLSKITGTGTGGRITRSDVEAFASGGPVKLQTKDAGGRIFASPNARRLAEELGVDICFVQGTGPNGKITGKDVEAYAKSKPASGTAGPAADQPGPGTEIKLTKMRRAIGISLQRSFHDTPHFNVTMSIDMTRAMEFRTELNKGKDKSQWVSVNDLVVKACALSLKKYPSVNSILLDDAIKYHADVNIGVATAVDAGLIVPVVLNADKRDWFDLAAETKRVVSQARNGKLVGAGKGTFTVSNLGMFGVDEFTAIINPPEAAILAVGGIKQEVVSINGMIDVKPLMKVTLCSDHRIVDGAIAAQFLGGLKRYLEEDIA
jgi:pyruvate dehydrogenase E2 component (dihydrolipoamide acetyltransferase)